VIIAYVPKCSPESINIFCPAVSKSFLHFHSKKGCVWGSSGVVVWVEAENLLLIV